MYNSREDLAAVQHHDSSAVSALHLARDPVGAHASRLMGSALR